MSRIPVREWYERTNAEWEVGRAQVGGTLPIPSADEALKGAKKLWRYAVGNASGATLKGVTLVSGRRYTWVKRSVLYVNPDRLEANGRGWQSIVHDLSHRAYYLLYGRKAKPHTKIQAILEKNMIREVIKRGFLVGSLRGEEQASQVLMKPEKDFIEKPSAQSKAFNKLEVIRERIARWKSKAKRAENALKKLSRQEKYYAKRAGK